MHPPQSADEILDARGLSCPMPLLKTKLALQQLSAGSILQVLATDSGSNQDIPAYLETMKKHREYWAWMDEWLHVTGSGNFFSSKIFSTFFAQNI